MFSGILDEDCHVKLPLKSVWEYAIFWGDAPNSPSNSMVCMFVGNIEAEHLLTWLEINHQKF